MNKKTIFKVLFLTIIGGIVGFIISVGLLNLLDAGNRQIASNVRDLFVKNNIIIFLLLLILIYLPSVYLFIQGKRIFAKVDNMSDEECESQSMIGQRKFDLALAINGVFMILNFMLFGMTYADLTNNEMVVLSIFMVNIFSSSILEIMTIRAIQKANTRLKGDPTSLRFSKDFLESCDEAERMKIYKTAFHSFQLTKQVALAFVVLTILCNLLLDTGGFPVFVSTSLMLTIIASHSYYAIYKN